MHKGTVAKDAKVLRVNSVALGINALFTWLKTKHKALRPLQLTTSQVSPAPPYIA